MLIDVIISTFVISGILATWKNYTMQGKSNYFHAECCIIDKRVMDIYNGICVYLYIFDPQKYNNMDCDIATMCVMINIDS